MIERTRVQQIGDGPIGRAREAHAAMDASIAADAV